MDQPPLCACGCGAPVERRKRRASGWNAFVKGHQQRGVQPTGERHADRGDLTTAGVARNGSARLSIEQVAEIKRLIGTATLEAIAVRFGVTDSTVWAIKSGRIWRDVPAHRATS